MGSECIAQCVWIHYKRHRSMIARLRGGMAELEIEVGRWHGVRREGIYIGCVRNVEVGKWKM